MNSAVSNSIVARCLLEPEFLSDMRRNPEVALRHYRMDAADAAAFNALDISRVERFAGFIAKVQHNFLWTAFPCTRALLKLYDIEIAVFTAYYPTHRLLKSQGATKDEQTNDFVAFLRKYLESRNPAPFPALRDVLLHEYYSWEIKGYLATRGRQDTQRADARLPKYSAPLTTIRPQVRGLLRVADFAIDPLAALAELRETGRIPVALTSQTRRIAYWGDPTSHEMRMFELSDGALLLLRLMDGKKDLGSIIQDIRRRLSGEVMKRDLRAFLVTAFSDGLLMDDPAAQPAKEDSCESCSSTICC